MKKFIFVLSLLLSYRAFGDCPDNVVSCGTTDDGLTWTISNIYETDENGQQVQVFMDAAKTKPAKKLTISGTGAMADYNSNDNKAPWFSEENRLSIKDVEIENGITHTGNWAFYALGKATNLSIPNTVTSIGNSSFSDMTNLTELTIPNSVTEIGSQAFYNVSSVTSLVIPDSVTCIGHGAFAKMIGLTGTVVIPDSVTSIDGYNVFSDTNFDTLYCPSGKQACITRSDMEESKIKTYGENSKGFYETSDGKFFASVELLALDKNGDKACKDAKECEKILEKIQKGQSFFMNGKFYQSLSDWANGIYERKRIYTIEEAQAVVKEIGKDHVTFRIRYK